MAAFDRALRRTLDWEGGYAADPDDPGGETWQGISRRYHPAWPGWALVDTGVRDVARLASLVRAFYRQQYWQPLRGDEWPRQRPAEATFDGAVHGGLQTAVRRLQRALNLCGASPALQIDGRMGARTLAALAAVKDEAELLCAVQMLRAADLLRQAETHPEVGKYLRGWMRRVGAFLTV